MVDVVTTLDDSAIAEAIKLAEMKGTKDIVKTLIDMTQNKL